MSKISCAWRGRLEHLPELPEVQTVVNSLKKIINTKILDFNPIWNKIVYNHPSSSIIKVTKNKKVYNVQRLGKYIIIILKDTYIAFHLRMTGHLYNITNLPTNKYIRCYFTLDNNTYLVYEDIRKFGGFYYLKNLELINNKLGIDPFNKQFNFKWLLSNLKIKNRQIKSLLLDQKFICGLGNIYIDEILWKTKIHPLRISSTLTKKEITLLHKNIVTTFEKSIKYHGSTILNFKFDNMKTGGYSKYLNVYNKTNQKCSFCFNKITKIKVASRGTHICRNCQKI